MANSFSTTYPEVFSKALLNNFDKETVMGNIVNRDYEGDIKNAGDIVNAVLFGNVTVGNYTPGTDLAVQNLTLTNYQMNIDQKKGFNAVIDLVEIKQSHLKLVEGWMKRSGVAMAETVDDRLLGHYADVDAGNIIGSDAAPITLTKDNIYEYFVQAGELLDADGIPSSERYAVIDENTKGLILKSPDFVKATATGDQVVRNGKVGTLAGFDVRMTPRLTAVSSVKNLMFIHKEYISLAFQIPADYVEMYKPQNQFGTGMKGLALYGSKVFLPTAGVVLKRAA